MIDWIELRERLCGNDELVDTIVEIFVDECPGWLAAVVEAVDMADAERIRTTAHALKGAAGNLSAHAVTAIAGRLERLGRDGNLETAGEVCAELSLECDRLLRALRLPRVH